MSPQRQQKHLLACDGWLLSTSCLFFHVVYKLARAFSLFSDLTSFGASSSDILAYTWTINHQHVKPNIDAVFRITCRRIQSTTRFNLHSVSSNRCTQALDWTGDMQHKQSHVSALRTNTLSKTREKTRSVSHSHFHTAFARTYALKHDGVRLIITWP
jgi:hypothetical protein